MSSSRLHITALAALLGGAAFVFTGAIQATHGDFGGTHNTLDSTAEYLVTAGFALALFLTAPAYRVLGALAGAPRLGIAAMVPQLVVGAMCVVSVVNGEDPSVFNAVAPACILTWLGASIALGVKLRRAGTVPTRLALALPFLVIVTLALSPVGGPLLTGAFWLALATHVLRQGEPQAALA
ncbi:MAG TPA: hypothetical protein VHF89_01080 [Solirubrobacteraceae bacterium]|nr:hypothetical protein [Solirubrobacteraceae bacterium]